jgi:hypothetical protein
MILVQVGRRTTARCAALAFDQTFFEHFFVAEPEIRDIRGTQAKNVFQGSTHFAATEIHAYAVEKVQQLLCAFGQERLRFCAHAVQAMVRKHIDGARPGAVADDVEKSACLRNRDIWR